MNRPKMEQSSSSLDSQAALAADFSTIAGIVTDDSRNLEIQQVLHQYRAHGDRLNIALNILLGAADADFPAYHPADGANEKLKTNMGESRSDDDWMYLPGEPRDRSNLGCNSTTDPDCVVLFETQNSCHRGQQDGVSRRAELLDPKRFQPNDFLSMFPDPATYFHDSSRHVSLLYKQHTMIQLQNEFPDMPEAGLRQYMAVHNCHYLPAKKHIAADTRTSGQSQLQQTISQVVADAMASDVEAVLRYRRSRCIVAPAGDSPAGMLTALGNRKRQRTTSDQSSALNLSSGSIDNSAPTTILVGRQHTSPWPNELCEEFFFELQFAFHEARILSKGVRVISYLLLTEREYALTKRVSDLQLLRQLRLEMAHEDGLAWQCALCLDEFLPEELTEAGRDVCKTCLQTYGSVSDFVSAKTLASEIESALESRGQSLLSDATIAMEDTSTVRWHVQDNIPVYWLSIKTQTSHAKIDLPRSSAEFKRIVKAINVSFNEGHRHQRSAMFSHAYSTGATGANGQVAPWPVITRIQRIENVALYSQYLIQKSKIEKACPHGHIIERMLFHGTSSICVNGICENGFDRSRAGASAGTAYGHGTYFSPQFRLSRRYARDGQILYCNVLVGESVQGDSQLRALPNKGNSALTFESAVDNMVNPSAYVIFADFNAYPAYLITIAH